jgi:hypothetical protein
VLELKVVLSVWVDTVLAFFLGCGVLSLLKRSLVLGFMIT